jgi:hypothetical protein
MIPSGNNSPAARPVVGVSVDYFAAGLLVPGGIIHPVVSVSVYYFAAGLLVPEGIICPVVSVSVYYFAAGLLVPGGITRGLLIQQQSNQQKH